MVTFDKNSSESLPSSCSSSTFIKEAESFNRKDDGHNFDPKRRYSNFSDPALIGKAVDWGDQQILQLSGKVRWSCHRSREC